MNRYRSPRRRSSSGAAAPIVAFLLIACFGLLFVTGCSSTVSGPNSQGTTQDDTFTQDDVARFEQLAQQSSVTSGTGAVGEDMTSSRAPAALADTGSAAVMPVPSVDPALRSKYDAIRASSGGNGQNMYRVTNTFVNVRSAPNVSAALLTRLNQGDLVTVTQFTNATWAAVALPGGKTGYTSLKYLAKLTTTDKIKDEMKAFDGQYFVNFAFVNVRAAPQTGAAKIGEIPGQAFVKPVSMDKTWAKVTFEGKDGYVSTQYLSLFKPNFLVRQESFTLPILLFDVSQPGIASALGQDAAKLKQDGSKLITVRDLASTLQTQEVRDVSLPAHAVILGVTGITAQNIQGVTDALMTAGVPATLFLQTDQVGISGITEKMLSTLEADGFDIQSAGHTGDDLRTLTNAQTQLELGQSRALLEQNAHSTVLAIAYPQGGANDRVLQQAADAGYLFGIGTAPDKTFTRDQFLRLPSYAVTSGMTPDDIVKLAQ